MPGPGRFRLTRLNRVLAPGAFSEGMHRAFGAFISTGARVVSPRVGATLRAVERSAGRETWEIEDSAERLF